MGNDAMKDRYKYDDLIEKGCSRCKAVNANLFLCRNCNMVYCFSCAAVHFHNKIVPIWKQISCVSYREREVIIHGK